MPPSGTTGKSSSRSAKSTGARGPTGPKGQARASPAGVKAGAVSRSANKTQEKSYISRINDTLRSITGADKFERQRDTIKSAFAKKAPKTAAAVEKVANALSIGSEYSPMGGPAVGMVRGLGRGVSKAEKTAKIISDLKKKEQELSKYVGKSGKIPIDEKKVFGPRSLSEQRARNASIPGEKIWDTVESGIDKVTSAMGFGTGPMARTKATSVLGGVGAAQNAAISEGVAAYRDREKSKTQTRSVKPAKDKSRFVSRAGKRDNKPENFLATGPFTQPVIQRKYSKGGLAKAKNTKTRNK